MADVTLIEETPQFEYYRRDEPEGYDTQSETIAMNDVLSWQSAFPTIAANGEQTNSRRSSSSKCY